MTGTSTTGSGSATITGGTGTYAGATGSFPSITGSGSGSIQSGITLTFTGAGSITTGGTTGGGGGGGTTTPPTITAVWDSASNTVNLAQGSIFIVKGSNLCPSGVKVFSVPRPTVSPDGVKITFTPSAGGSGTDAILVYTYNPSGTCQLAGILPSTVAPGNYNVVVTNGTASAPFATKVLQRKFSLFTQDSSGTGLASVQNYISASQVDLNSFTTGNGKATTISPAHPGQFVIAWGTGMGPLVGGDNSASPLYDFSANGVKVNAVVGGMTVPVAYAGRAGYAGEDQINVQLPANVPTGCTVSFQISVDGVLSNSTFIAIAPDANASACVMPGFTTQQLQNFDNGGTYTIGAFSLSSISESLAGFSGKFEGAGGAFIQFSGFQLSGTAQYSATPSNGCQVIHITQSGSNPVSTGGGKALDAGQITLTGPAASNINNLALTQTGNTYYASLSSIPGLGGSTNTSLVAGTYSLTGAGGADVGAFNTSITMGTPLIVNGGTLPATIVRASGLPLTWTGGNASDYVEIVGYAGNVTGTGTNTGIDATEFICTTTAGTGGFTVPASVLNQLPAVSASATTNGTGTSFLEVISSVNPVSFTAPLKAGGNIDFGAFLALSGIGSVPTYQ